MRLNPKDRAPRRARAGRRRRIAVAGFAAAGLAAAGAGVWNLPRIERIDADARTLRADALDLSAQAGLRIRDVVLSGRRNADAEEILAALDVERGAPILALDMDAARGRLESLGWIRSAEIARRLPDVVYVRIVEREPFALWQHDGRVALVDRFGEIIQRSDLEAFAHLPLVVGDGAPKYAAQLIDLLHAYPEVAEVTEAAVRVSERRWNLRLRNGIDVRLPEHRLAVALARLDEFNREHALIERDIVAVDLRVPDRLIVRVGAGAKPKPRAQGKDT